MKSIKKENIVKSYLYSKQELCFELEELFHKININTTPQKFASITNNQFIPTTIRKSRVPNSELTELSVTYNEKTFSKIVNGYSFNINEKLVDFLNEIAVKNGLKGGFYNVMAFGDIHGTIYLSENQAQFLEQNNFLSFYQ